MRTRAMIRGQPHWLASPLLLSQGNQHLRFYEAIGKNMGYLHQKLILFIGCNEKIANRNNNNNRLFII